MRDDAAHGLTMEEIHRLVVATGASADFSSVYRAVIHLEREGEISRIDLGDGATRFEAEAGHHEHVRCERCGAVAGLPGCLLGQVAESVRSITGFSVSEHSLVLSGRCAQCQAVAQ